jgi:hypothetical protein
MKAVRAPKLTNLVMVSTAKIRATASVTTPTNSVALKGVRYLGWILERNPEAGEHIVAAHRVEYPRDGDLGGQGVGYPDGDHVDDQQQIVEERTPCVRSGRTPTPGQGPCSSDG